MPGPVPDPGSGGSPLVLAVRGTIPTEVWNRLGTKILPKLKSGADLKLGLDFSVTVDAAQAQNLKAELEQILEEMGLAGQVSIALTDQSRGHSGDQAVRQG
jgi:hypothetical protein